MKRNLLNIGDTITAVINSVTDDGLSVEFNNFQGVVRIIDLQWDLSDVLELTNKRYKIGDSVELKVIAINENMFLGSVKELYPIENPWLTPSIYKTGSIFQGVVLNILDYGYIVKLSTGAISHLIDNKGQTLKVDDTVKVKITGSDSVRKKISVEISD